MMGQSPRCYIPSFIEIGPAVPEKKFSKDFYHIWAWQPSWSCDLDHYINFDSPFLRIPHIKFGFEGEVVPEKNKF